MKRLFTQHPASVGETYPQHLMQAGGFGLRMVLGGLACLVHAALPFVYVSTGSQIVSALHDRMLVNRTRRAAAEPPASGVPLPDSEPRSESAS